MDRTSLTVSDEEFERNVEAAVSEIAQQNREVETLESKSAQEHLSATGGASPEQQQSANGQRSGGRDGPRSTSEEENAPVVGLLRTIQKPLSTIGKMFSDDAENEPAPPPTQAIHPGTSSASASTVRLTPEVYQPPRSSSEGRGMDHLVRAQDAAKARQASAEEAEARKIHLMEHNNAVENLTHMFPNLERDLIDDVVRTKQGR